MSGAVTRPHAPDHQRFHQYLCERVKTGTFPPPGLCFGHLAGADVNQSHVFSVSSVTHLDSADASPTPWHGVQVLINSA